jgi:hypothetical protein
VISSGISCLNVLSQHVSSQEGNEDNEDDDESSDDSTGEDHKRRGSRVASPLMSPTKTMIGKTLVSPLRMGSPGRDSVAATDRSSFLSPMRRGSVQSRNSLRRGSRTQPAQLLADYRALTNLRKTLANKFGSLTTVFAFSVLLGGFDRKLMIRPILTATIPPVASATASPSKQRLEVSCSFLFLSLPSFLLTVVHRNQMKLLGLELELVAMSRQILLKMLKRESKLPSFLCGL